MAKGGLSIYRGCTPVVDAEYDRAVHRSPSEVIIDALASAADVDPTELPPLYDFVDPDALDRLFDGHRGAADADATLSFTAETWNVFVCADGRIRVCDATRPTDPKPVFAGSTA